MKEEIELAPEDFEEEIEVKIDNSAFKSEDLHCSNCNKKMSKVDLNIKIPDTSLTLHITSFRCKECDKEYLNGDQAEKLDRALAIAKVIEGKGTIYERAGNFDGSNVFVRFPAQMIKGDNVKAEIIPLSPTEFFVHFKKKEKTMLT